MLYISYTENTINNNGMIKMCCFNTMKYWPATYGNYMHVESGWKETWRDKTIDRIVELKVFFLLLIYLNAYSHRKIKILNIFKHLKKFWPQTKFLLTVSCVLFRAITVSWSSYLHAEQTGCRRIWKRWLLCTWPPGTGALSTWRFCWNLWHQEKWIHRIKTR